MVDLIMITTGGVSCIISLTLLFKNQGRSIDFVNHNPDNTRGITKEACMQAFQNKFKAGGSQGRSSEGDGDDN